MMNYLFSCCIFAVLLVCSGSTAAAQVFRQPQLAVLVDPNGSETIDSVSAPGRQQDFKPLAGAFTAGYTRKVHWLRFTLTPLSSQAHDEVIEIQPPYLRDLRLYEPLHDGTSDAIDTDGTRPQSYRVHVSGSRLPFDDREFDYRGFAFKVAVSGTQPEVFYLRVQTTSSSVVLLRQWTADRFATANLREYAFIGIFFGILMTVVILNLLLWIWTREVLFKYYIIYVGSLTLFSIAIDGFLAQYFLPQLPYWVDKWISLGLFICVSCSMPFLSSIVAIDVASKRRWHWLYRLLFWLPILLLPAPFLEFFPEVAPYVMVLLMLALIVGLCRSFALLSRKRTLSSVFVLIAHICGLSGFLSTILTLLGWSLGGLWTVYGFQIGLIMEATIFSMAISIRIGEAAMERRRDQLRIEIAEQKSASELKARKEQERFMAMLTHELKTPMSVIRIALHSVGVTSKTMQHTEQAFDDISNVIDRCIQVDRLQQQPSVVRMEALDLDALAEKLVRQSGQQERIRLTTDAAALVETDYQYATIILANLLDNALKYAATDSIVALSITPRMQAGQEGIEISLENKPGPAGMPAREQVFKKYYRSAGAHAKTGSGLGLYLVHSISSLLNISVRYVPGVDTVRFELWFPLHNQGPHNEVLRQGETANIQA